MNETEEEKKKKYDEFLKKREAYISRATFAGFSEDQALFLWENFMRFATLLGVDSL